MPGATAEPPVATAPVAAPAPTPAPKDLTIPSPSDPPRSGTARERMQKETAKKWEADVPKGVETPETPRTTKSPETPAPRPGDEPAGEAPPAPADVPADKKKQNPWQTVRTLEKQVETLQREVSSAKSASLAEQEKSQYLERIEQAEAKVKTYEDEIRFKAYERSEEFATKYEKPYNAAWERAMKDMRGVTITGEDGVARPMEAKDILDLVNLELPDARELADAKWGKFAGDAMTWRKEIRNLFESKAIALDEARKNGAERERQTGERTQRWQKEANEHVKTTWNTENQRALSDPVNGEFFKPSEGDETRNQLLGKGFALVDKAFAENPMDPRHTPEQRAEIVRRHAAVRNRAAAFGPMKYIIAKLRSQLAELEKANARYKESEPSTAGGSQATSGAQPLTGRAKMLAAQDRFARG